MNQSAFGQLAVQLLPHGFLPVLGPSMEVEEIRLDLTMLCLEAHADTGIAVRWKGDYGRLRSRVAGIEQDADSTARNMLYLKRVVQRLDIKALKLVRLTKGWGFVPGYAADELGLMHSIVVYGRIQKVYSIDIHLRESQPSYVTGSAAAICERFTAVLNEAGI